MTYKALRVRMYVGPLSVEHFAKRAEANGYTDIIQGTEHLIFTTGPIEMDDKHPATARLVARQRIGEYVHGQPMTAVWRDVEIIREGV